MQSSHYRALEVSIKKFGLLGIEEHNLEDIECVNLGDIARPGIFYFRELVQTLKGVVQKHLISRHYC